MSHSISLSEAFGHFELPAGACEAVSTGEAHYDEAAGQVVVTLDAFLRTTDLRHKEAHFRPDWLPQPQTLSERVGAEEASDLARDAFQRWTRKVRESAPAAPAVSQR